VFTLPLIHPSIQGIVLGARGELVAIASGEAVYYVRFSDSEGVEHTKSQQQRYHQPDVQSFWVFQKTNTIRANYRNNDASSAEAIISVCGSY
jgi:hypothetical protein